MFLVDSRFVQRIKLIKQLGVFKKLDFEEPAFRDSNRLAVLDLIARFPFDWVTTRECLPKSLLPS